MSAQVERIFALDPRDVQVTRSAFHVQEDRIRNVWAKFRFADFRSHRYRMMRGGRGLRESLISEKLIVMMLPLVGCEDV